MGNFFRRNQGSSQPDPIEEPNLPIPSKPQIVLRNEISKIDFESWQGATEGVNHLLQKETWCIDFDKENQSYPYLLSLIKQCRGVLTLCMSYQSDSMFLVYIKPVGFPHLRKLSLSNCHLQSLDQAVGLKIPHVEQLCFSDNYITDLRPLRKISSPITILNVRNNFIRSLDALPLINFARCATALNIEEGGPKTYGQDISYLFKMAFKSIQRIEINGKERIGILQPTKSMLGDMFEGDTKTFYWGPKIRETKQVMIELPYF